MSALNELDAVAAGPHHDTLIVSRNRLLKTFKSVEFDHWNSSCSNDHTFLKSAPQGEEICEGLLLYDFT